MSSIVSKQTTTATPCITRRVWQQQAVRVGHALLLPFVLLCVWSVAATLHWFDPKVVPSPVQVVATLWQTFTQLSFWQGVVASLSRNLIGYLLGASLALLFALWVGQSKIANWFFAPSFHILRQISFFAWLPLLSSFLGTGNGAKILFITVSVFYPVALHSLAGIRSISHKHQDVAVVYQFPLWYRYQKLILPAAAPQIFVGLQLGLIFAWLATIGSEFLLANYGVGLGNLVIRGREQFNVALILVGMLIIGLLGIALNRILQVVERRVLAWQPRGET